MPGGFMNILFITTLHQGFNDYAHGLNKTQRNEWDKVKGRLKEITFNEPVEQLLLLAAERISSRQGKIKKINRLINYLILLQNQEHFH